MQDSAHSALADWATGRRQDLVKMHVHSCLETLVSKSQPWLVRLAMKCYGILMWIY